MKITTFLKINFCFTTKTLILKQCEILAMPKMNLASLSGVINRVTLYKKNIYTGWDFKMWPLAV